MKAAEFWYEGRSKDGAVRKGKIRALSVQEAKERLRETGLFIHKIKKADRSRRVHKLPSRAVILLCMQMAMLLRSGLSMQAGIQAMYGQAKERAVRAVLEQLDEAMQEGKALHEGLRETGAFSDLLVELIRAGELSGTADQACIMLASHYEERKKEKDRIKTAMAYPMLVIGITLLFGIAAFCWILPVFADFFAVSGREIPRFLWYAVQVGELIKQPAGLGTLVAGAAGIGWLIYRQKALIGPWMGQTIPGVREMYRLYYQKRISDILALLLEGGIPLYPALETAERAVGNEAVRKAVFAVKMRLAEGYSLAESIGNTSLASPVWIQMIAMGEAAGELEIMLHEFSRYAGQELAFCTEAAEKLIEPAVLLLAGIAVLGTVLGIAVPMLETITVGAWN